MRAKLLATGVILLIVFALAMLIVAVVAPRLLDPRNFAAWRERRAEVVPLTFFAKVVDERGEPVTDATIKLRVLTHSHKQLVGEGFVDYHDVLLNTDSSGRARLDGYDGFTIYVDDVSKSGYQWLFDEDNAHYQGQTSTDNRAFYYSAQSRRYKADPDNPAVFPLYREGVARAAPGAGSAALPSRGGTTDGVPGRPFEPRDSSLESRSRAGQ